MSVQPRILLFSSRLPSVLHAASFAPAQNRRVLLRLPPFHVVDEHFGHPFKASIALWNAFAA